MFKMYMYIYVFMCKYIYIYIKKTKPLCCITGINNNVK